MKQLLPLHRTPSDCPIDVLQAACLMALSAGSVKNSRSWACLEDVLSCALFQVTGTLEGLSMQCPVWYRFAGFYQSSASLDRDLCSVNSCKCRASVEDLVQFKMVSMRSKKPIGAPPRLPEVSLTLPLKRFQCSSD